LSSAQVVTRVRHVLGGKAGHAGTLDPLATGVLLVCVGEGTKLAPYLLADDKGYDGEFELGVETDTLDSTGAVVANAPTSGITDDAIRAAAAALVGAQEQIPPMFSAIHHAGRRLFELAREGVEVERQPRSIAVSRFAIVGIDLPRVRFSMECTKGTYVRVLVADLGKSLGCGAHLTALRRTRSGRFSVDHATPLDHVNADRLIALPDILELPSLEVADSLVNDVVNGRLLDLRPSGKAERHKLVTSHGDLLAIAVPVIGGLRVERGFRYGLTKLPTFVNLPAD
jgi:tRNA pseudouridine55 synthase